MVINFILRLFEILITIILLIVLSPIFFIVTFIIFFNNSPILYWSKRVGKNSKIFLMPKFSTMKKNTPDVATHLLNKPNQYLNYYGNFLRKTSIDELPQLYSILVGNMTFIGPRPALYNQYDLIKQRYIRGINLIKPGITGWAQVNGRDEISINEKINLDYYYLKNKSFYLNIKILLLTFSKALNQKNVKH